NAKTRTESGYRNGRIDEGGDQHDGHQKAGAAPRMVGGKLLGKFNTRNISLGLIGKDRLVFGPVVFVNAANIGPQGDTPDKKQEQGHANGAIGQIEKDIVV